MQLGKGVWEKVSVQNILGNSPKNSHEGFHRKFTNCITKTLLTLNFTSKFFVEIGENFLTELLWNI